jgi:hypothetical protein
MILCAVISLFVVALVVGGIIFCYVQYATGGFGP